MQRKRIHITPVSSLECQFKAIAEKRMTTFMLLQDIVGELVSEQHQRTIATCYEQVLPGTY